METIAYIDGYNLYYGRLRKSSFKWIDVVSLVKKICIVQNPSTNLIKVKYFTAPVRANFASHGQQSSQSQNTYHNALKKLNGDMIEIINGYHTVEKGTPPIYQKPIDRKQTVDVWKFEEKQTDVNIAMHMYRDALQLGISQLVLVSNDSDLESALKFIKEDFNIQIGLIIPKKENKDHYTSRPVTKYLDQYSDWTRKHILDDECKKSLMPDTIPTSKKPIRKPDYW